MISDRPRLRTELVRLQGWLVALLLATQLWAQTQPMAPAQFDPSDAYFQGYLAIRNAEQLEKAGDFTGALEKLQRARQLLETIRQYHPDWKANMVSGRSAKTAESIERVRALADAELAKRRNTLAELEGGVTEAQTDNNPPASPAESSAAGIFEGDPRLKRRLTEAEAEIQRLRESLAAQQQSQQQGSSNMNELRRERDELRAQLKAAESTAKALRDQLAAAPIREEMTTLNRRLAALEQERNAMAMALNQSRSAHDEAKQQISSLEKELKEIRQQQANLERDLKAERDISNSVVTGQRRQLEALERQLKNKDEELAEANQTIAKLITELDEARAVFAELRDERDSLLSERDQMAALLKLNEASRIQDLIEQNMALAKNLREANEKVERLNIESNNDKDAYTEALRDLAIAKSQINRLNQERRAQDQRLAEMEQRLKDEEQALANGQIDANPEEVATLREIIRNQLLAQERRRQARALLLDAARQLAVENPEISRAVELLDSQEVALSPEEQKLVADQEVDGEFVSPFARDRATVGQATSELERDIAVFERTAEKSFLAGRLLPTRELYQMILEQHPGHTPSLCRLGVVHLRLNEDQEAADTFRRAVELDENNVYAHRMLAFSLLRLGDIAAAEQSASTAVEKDATDAKGQMLLATILYRIGRSSEAESHFKAAINADPLPSEPYYNLALICLRSDRIEEARAYYQQAMERGALPDPELEHQLTQP